MNRPSIADLARAANVSISTVDRVLNGRHPVRQATAERILATAESIGFRAATAIRLRLTEARPKRTFGFVLQQRTSRFYQDLGDALTEATRAAAAIRGKARVEFLDDLSAGSVANSLRTLGRAADAMAVVAADHPEITAAIGELKERGVPVFALISDLTAPGLAGYIGLDNRKVGRTAGWFIAHLAKRPGKVGILVGSHRYICQDECEISFRSYFREHAPEFQLMESVVTLEDERYAHQAVEDLLSRAPDLAGLFIGGGGIKGVLRALAGSETARNLVVVCLDGTEDSRPSLINGVMKIALNHPPRQLAGAVVQAMIQATGKQSLLGLTEIVVQMEIQTAENV